MIGLKSGRMRWPAGALGALVLIAAVEAFVVLHDLDFTTPAKMEWRMSSRAATERAPGHDVLSLGTSMSKLGLFPSVVEKESGRTTFNLAHCAGRVPGAYFLLRRALEAGARPSTVLLEVHPSYATIPFREATPSWPDLLKPRDCLDLAWTSGDASFFLSTMLARTLPSYNARPEIRASVLAALNGASTYYRKANTPLLRNLDQNAGAWVHRRDTPYGGEINPIYSVLYLSPGWSIDKLNEVYLHRLLDLCGSRQIQVYWVIPPIAPSLQASREAIGLDAAYTQFTKRIQAAYPGMVVLDARHSGYENPAFMDAAHLDYKGGVVFSTELGRILKDDHPKPVGPGSWIAMPAYRDRAVDAPLEEMAQSVKVVEEAATLKR